MVQRSGDMLTASGAGGINEIQYAALLMMIARSTGYEPGVFTHFVANEQIYDRHVDNAHELLERAKAQTSGKEPSLVLKCAKGVNIKTITIDDFEMHDYEPMEPQLKFELGI
jgi:thymidylate synthase